MSGQTDISRQREASEEVEIDLVELLLFYRARWLSVLFGLLSGAVVMAAVTVYLITPKYTATSKLYMVSASSDSIVDLTDLNIGTSLSSDYEELLKVRPIIEEVIKDKELGYTYEELLEQIDISTISDTRILTITAESTSPEEAMAVANALADKAVKELPDLMDTAEPNIAERAVLPEKQSSPSLAKNTIIGAFVGMLLILAIHTVFFITDDTLKSADDVEKAFGVMPLTVIPEGDVEEISDKKEKEIRRQKKKRYRGKHERKE